jgi:von Willebrand factor type A domain
MNRNNIRIACILDKSGSMASNSESTINSFNNFINELKADSHGYCTLKLVQFDDEYSVTFDRTLLTVPALTSKLYQPHNGGSTALLDAQGRTIDELGAELRAMHENERPGKVIVVTITDGLENASKHYTHGQVSEMIEHQQKVYNWDFLYLGANQDAIKVGGSLNIPQYRSMTYRVGDPAAVAATYHATAQAVNSLRSYSVQGQSTANVGFSEQDRQSAIGGDGGTVVVTANPEEPAINSR